MKKLLIILSLFFINACNVDKIESTDIYKGYIVKDKTTYGLADKYALRITKDSIAKEIRVYKYDYEIYEPGDTIQ